MQYNQQLKKTSVTPGVNSNATVVAYTKSLKPAAPLSALITL